MRPLSISEFNRRCRQIFTLLSGLVFLAGAPVAMATGQFGVVINEVDYDQPSTDDAEFVELYNGTGTPLSLDGVTLEFVNGSSDSIYDTIALPNVSLPAGGYFVVCANAATVANCDLDDGPDTNFIQNGAPDAIGLRSFGTLIDAVSYEGTVAAPYFETTGNATGDTAAENVSMSRVPNGTDTDNNANDFALACSTPGAANAADATGCVVDDPPTVSSTNPADSATDVPVNSAISVTFSEDVTSADGSFSIDCGGPPVPFSKSGGPGTFILTPLSDLPAGVLCTITTAAAGIADLDGDPDNMAVDFIFSFTTASEVIELPDIVINETDADTAGTDVLEFVELYDGGAGMTDLSGLVVVLFNGSDDASYNAFDLDGFSTDANGYFVLGNTDVANVGLVFGSNGLQNGADAAALFLGNGTDFPNDTPVTTTNLIDAIVYDTDDGDDAGLLPLLNAGEPQVNERDGGDGTGHSNQRCPNGSGGGRNTSTYIQEVPTPGAANDCPTPIINEVDADTDGTDVLEFIELFDGGVGNLPLNGFVVVLFNGSGGTSYNAFDLDGFSTDVDGYFVLGNAAVANVDIVFGSNGLQNGADAVALYIGDADDFPNGTAVTTVNLIDAIVYDTNDADDPDVLPLLNAGQPQVNEGGNGNQAFDSNQRCPNGFGGERNTDSYDQALPTPGVANVCPPKEIWEIQGNGSASPFAGFSVNTDNNIVTALAPDGFFMQTPPSRSDNDINTSDGIFVFTGGAPGVFVGDHVNVDGPVVEFFDFTEFSLPTVISAETGEGDGNGEVITPVEFNASVPSPNPAAPSCAIEYECYEGMLINIASGVVTGGNQRFNSDIIAEAYIVAKPDRTYTETGALFPGLGGSIPTWDGNPEVFELDPDKLGLPNQALAAGSTFSATGVLGYEFSGYELWPSSLTTAPANSLAAVRPATTGEMTVGALNMFVLDQGAGDLPNRAAKLSNYIRNTMRSPDIIAVSEVFSLTELGAVAAQITADDPGVVYTPFLIDHNNVGFGIDVGFLIGADVEVDSIVQQGLGELHTFDNTPLHDRPPLLFQGRYTGNGLDFPFAVLAVHNRSLGGITDPVDGPRVRSKRLEQAQSIAAKAQAFQTANPDTPYMIIGDANAFQFTDGLVDVIGQMKGDVDPAMNLLSGPDLVDPNLTNQVDLLPPLDRYSFVFQGNAGMLDHVLTSSATDIYARGMNVGRGNSDEVVDRVNDLGTANRSSDHDGIVFYMMTDFDGDGFPDDQDLCPFGAGANGDEFNNSSLVDGCTVPIPATDFRGLMILALLLMTLGAVAIRRTTI